MHYLSFGEYFGDLRRSRGVTLREFCREHNLDAGNTSKLERGVLRPPSADKLVRYAEALGLQPDSPEWHEFFDRAAISRGEIPPAILSEPAIVAQLPALFCRLGRRPLCMEEIDRLVDLIRFGNAPDPVRDDGFIEHLTIEPRPCPNCGVYRRCDETYMIEPCPNCGDDEINLLETPDVP